MKLSVRVLPFFVLLVLLFACQRESEQMTAFRSCMQDKRDEAANAFTFVPIEKAADCTVNILTSCELDDGVSWKESADQCFSQRADVLQRYNSELVQSLNTQGMSDIPKLNVSICTERETSKLREHCGLIQNQIHTFELLIFSFEKGI